MIKWHRLFGMVLTDFFMDSSFSVELEVDLSMRQQLLDVVIIEKGDGPTPSELPAGLDNLAAHNLMTYKSHRQSLDEWALDELLGHFVNYRKQVGPSSQSLPAKSEFGLYAVSTRVPAKLMRSYHFEPVVRGVYETQWGSMGIRVIVLSEVSDDPGNALWQIFSAIPEKVRFGASWYQWHRNNLSAVLNDLFTTYKMDGIAMPYTVEDYLKESREMFFELMSPDDWKDFLKTLPPEERMRGVPPEERMKGVPPEERLKLFLPKDSLKKYTLDEVSKSVRIMFPELSGKDIERILKNMMKES